MKLIASTHALNIIPWIAPWINLFVRIYNVFTFEPKLINSYGIENDQSNQNWPSLQSVIAFFSEISVQLS